MYFFVISADEILLKLREWYVDSIFMMNSEKREVFCFYLYFFKFLNKWELIFSEIIPFLFGKNQ